MPRKKPLPKYVVIKSGQWYVRKRLPGLTHPVWRVCKDQTQEGVDAILADLKNDVLKPAPPAGRTVNEVFDEWLSSVRDQISVRTYEDYAENLDRYFRKQLGEKFADSVTENDIRAILDSMRDRGLSTRTRQYAHRVLASALKRAVVKGSIASNPVDHIKSPKVKRGEIVYYDLAESKKFFKVCNDYPEGTIFQFALESGMRPEEYAALQWPDIDLRKGTATVNRVVVHARSGGDWTFEPPKTKRSRRTVQISKHLCKLLVVHRKRQDAAVDNLRRQDNAPIVPNPEKMTTRQTRKVREARRRREAIANHETHKLVFPNAEFTPYTINNLGRRDFKKIATKVSNKRGITLKSLRHTCATLLLLAGVNPKIVSERLGHSSIVITLETYSHVLPTMQDHASEQLGEMLH